MQPREAFLALALTVSAVGSGCLHQENRPDKNTECTQQATSLSSDHDNLRKAAERHIRKSLERTLPVVLCSQENTDCKRGTSMHRANLSPFIEGTNVDIARRYGIAANTLRCIPIDNSGKAVVYVPAPLPNEYEQPAMHVFVPNGMNAGKPDSGITYDVKIEIDGQKVQVTKLVMGPSDGFVVYRLPIPPSKPEVGGAHVTAGYIDDQGFTTYVVFPCTDAHESSTWMQ